MVQNHTTYTGIIHALIKFTVSETIRENKTMEMERDQIMRWIRHGVGGEGVTVRLCIRRGKVTLYVSSIPNPSNAVHDYQKTIEPEDNIAITCTTYFQHSRPIRGRRRRSEVSDTYTETVYISIVGQDNSSLITLQTANGNVTLGKVYKPVLVHVEELHECVVYVCGCVPVN